MSFLAEFFFEGGGWWIVRPGTAAPYMEVAVRFLEGGLVDREAGYCCTLHGSWSAFFGGGFGGS